MFTWDDAKNPGETKTYAFDWSKALNTGDTVASASASLITAAGLTLIDGTGRTPTLSYVRVSGGTPGLTAAILSTIITANGETLTEVGRLSIVADNAPLASVADLTTLAAVKAYCGIQSSSDDTMLQALITSYSDWVRSVTSRDFTITSYDIWRSGYDNTQMALPQTPITGITSLAIDGRTIPAQPSFGEYGYRFTKRFLLVEGGAVFSRGQENIHIAYQAGYASVPTDIAQAVNELVGLRYANRDKQGWSSKSLAGETVSLVTKDMPASVATILNQYTRKVPA